MASNPRAHPRCINASNPYHQCSEYCYKKIAEQDSAEEGRREANEAGEATEVGPGPGSVLPKAFGRQPNRQPKKARLARGSYEARGPPPAERKDVEEPKVPEPAKESSSEEEEEEQGLDEASMANMNERQKKLFELRLKLNQARKLNQTAVVAEKQRENAPAEPRGVSKQKWYEDKKKKIGKQLEANGLDMKQAYMLDTQEEAEGKYKKWEKKPAPFGWDVFNAKTLYKAYEKRTKDIPYTMEEYEKAKASDPDFYRDSASLQYGQGGKIPEENVDKMVEELEQQARKRKEFSRRRKFYEEKDVDSINDRNAHFNRKIERAFGKYTTEIKNNLERGTALPD